MAESIKDMHTKSYTFSLQSIKMTRNYECCQEANNISFMIANMLSFK